MIIRYANVPSLSSLGLLVQVITEVDDGVNGFVGFYEEYHTYIWFAGVFLAVLLILHCCVVPLCLPCAVCYNCVKGCRQCFCCCGSRRTKYTRHTDIEC